MREALGEMKLEVRSENYNPLLKRKEIVFEVDHSEEGGTPRRMDVRKALAEELGVDLERVYVRRIETITGSTVALGLAHVYETAEQARFIEPKHIIVRNEGRPEEKEEGKE